MSEGPPKGAEEPHGKRSRVQWIHTCPEQMRCVAALLMARMLPPVGGATASEGGEGSVIIGGTVRGWDLIFERLGAQLSSRMNTRRVED